MEIAATPGKGAFVKGYSQAPVSSSESSNPRVAVCWSLPWESRGEPVPESTQRSPTPYPGFAMHKGVLRGVNSVSLGVWHDPGFSKYVVLKL